MHACTLVCVHALFVLRCELRMMELISAQHQQPQYSLLILNTNMFVHVCFECNQAGQCIAKIGQNKKLITRSHDPIDNL